MSRDNLGKKNNLQFELLPAYARFLLKNKLEDFVIASLEFSREEDLSILKFIGSYSHNQLVEMGKITTGELLSSLSNNNVRDYIEKGLARWISNQMGIIDQNDIAIDDITVGAFIRRKIFRKFLNEYTSDETIFWKIMDEVDRFTTENEVLSYNAYIQLHQERYKKINEELAKREIQLLEAQEIAEMGSFLWDVTDSKKSVYTSQVMKIFGLKEADKLESFFGRVHIDDRVKLKTAIDISLTNNGIYECEYRYLKGGEERHIWSKGMVEFENDKPLRMSGIVRDITIKNHMLIKLNDLNHSLSVKNVELERSNRELESFNYIASHDLQEPLRKIQTYSSRLNEHVFALPKAALDYLEKINISSSRMQSLIEDLLYFSQITISSEAFEHTDLNAVLRDVRQTLSDPIEKNNAKIIIENLPKINAVPFQLSQLFVNLIGNSIKYKKENVIPCINIYSKVVEIKSHYFEKNFVGGSYLRLSITDNGIGFDSEYKEKIFDLFTRLHAKDEYSGTGIGLSICKKIVHNHDGYIDAESKGGQGSSFHIYLPEKRIISLPN